ncbi:hypothetical protein HYQ46_002696 [Verticillium longisporum]|nr:hypothetical protein HYQ46_002696 [Verticillium longisporum]
MLKRLLRPRLLCTTGESEAATLMLGVLGMEIGGFRGRRIILFFFLALLVSETTPSSAVSSASASMSLPSSANVPGILDPPRVTVGDAFRA